MTKLLTFIGTLQFRFLICNIKAPYFSTMAATVVPAKRIFSHVINTKTQHAQTSTAGSIHVCPRIKSATDVECHCGIIPGALTLVPEIYPFNGKFARPV